MKKFNQGDLVYIPEHGKHIYCVVQHDKDINFVEFIIFSTYDKTVKQVKGSLCRHVFAATPRNRKLLSELYGFTFDDKEKTKAQILREFKANLHPAE